MLLFRIPYPDGPPFSPLELFASAEAGAWYDPTDIGTLWQDTAGTTPVTTAGDAVARVDDKSGNGTHLTQASAASRPIYQVDGNGNPYLLFDGIDDVLVRGTFSISLPFDRVSAIRQVTWAANDYVFWASSLAASLQQNGSSPQLIIRTGAIVDIVRNGELAVAANGVVTERHAAGASQLAVNNGDYQSGNAGSIAPTNLSIGATTSANAASNIRFYGAVIRGGQMSDAEMSRVRAWLASKAGVMLQGAP